MNNVIVDKNFDFFADTESAERALVCELIASPADIPDAMRLVDRKMFNDAHCRNLFGLIVDLFSAGESKHIETISMYSRIDPSEKEWYRAKVMGFQTTGSAVLMRDHALAIRTSFEGRRLFALSEELRSYAMAGAQLPEALEKIRGYMNVFETESQSKAKTVSEAFNILCGDLQSRTGRVTTGFPSLDRATYGGFAPGNLVILAARPSVGKTSVALNIARAMSAANNKVAFFSLEMTAAELAQKLCLGTDRLDSNDFRRDSLDWKLIEAAGGEISGIDLLIDDTSLTLDEICAQIVLLHSQGKCNAAMVDYLGLVEVTKDARVPLAIQLARATRRFKQLAKQLGIPIIVLCQLNRESSKEHRAPELHDLRDSGAIEQDADIVLMLQRNTDGMDLTVENDLESRRVDIWVRKNRGGRAGNFRIDLEANETFSRFHEVVTFHAAETPAPSAPPASAPKAPDYNPDSFHEPAERESQADLFPEATVEPLLNSSHHDIEDNPF